MARRTYIEVVNEVLKKLRQQTVGSVSSNNYSRLIGVLVNQAKREIEDLWPWTDLRKSTDITTAASTDTYSITDFGERYRIESVLNESLNRSRIMAIGHNKFEHLWPADQSGDPLYWRINSYDGSGDPKIQFYPIPNSVQTIEVNGIVGQPDLTADNQALLIPSWPVILRAHMLAIDERGEDGGDSTAYREAEIAITDAMAADNANQGYGWSSDWRVE